MEEFGVRRPHNPVAKGLPFLRLFDASGTMMDTNNNWETHTNASLIPSGLQPTNSLEPAIYTTLAPGAYTAHVFGVGATPTGIGLVEIFEVEEES